MHISEGILSPPVLLGGGLVCLLGTMVGLKKLKTDDVPKTAILSAAFFVGSLIHVPLGPSNVHLVLNGLLGIILGWAAFPAILIGLLFQAVFFQFGGLTVLGVNTVNMALPALLASALFGTAGRGRVTSVTVLAFVAGGGAVLGSGILVALSLALTGREFLPAAQIVLAAHLPVMVIEGCVAAAALSFIRKVRPEILNREGA